MSFPKHLHLQMIRVVLDSLGQHQIPIVRFVCFALTVLDSRWIFITHRVQQKAWKIWIQ
jgi:hypothetical protein